MQLAAAAAVSSPLLARGAETTDGYLNGRLYKTLKIGMVGAGKTLEEKFAVAKAAGFDGIELNAPGIDVEEVRAAIKATGLPVDGSVNAGHWSVRHTDADAATRAKALESLQEALRQTHAVGGNTVLLVVGRGGDGPEEEIWKRSIENISKAVPLAAELGVHIAIENVWNQFCYDHDGDHNQT
ncbi:MAG: sugar phosphate isomerase/epimerase, partial [Rhodopirellula sp.]|nr:sugar phosphate isomerase/epimerase [Rhodopirellula sp.]